MWPLIVLLNYYWLASIPLALVGPGVSAVRRSTISNNHAPPQPNPLGNASGFDKGAKQMLTTATAYPLVPVVMSPNGVTPPKFIYVPFLRRFAWVLQNIRPTRPLTDSSPALAPTQGPGSIGNSAQYPFHQSGATPSTTTSKRPPVPYEPFAPSQTGAAPGTPSTSAPRIKPVTTYKTPVPTRSPTHRDSCVVEPLLCPLCLSKSSISEPWFPLPPPLFNSNAHSRRGTLQLILNRLPDDVHFFSDILKLASFEEIVNFKEILTEFDDRVTVLAPTDAAFAYLPISIDDLKQRLLRNPKELRRFILFHFIPGFVNSRDFKLESWIATCLFEKSIYVNADRQLNGARILSHDISYKYGFIHTLGRVLYPVSADSVLIFLESNSFLSEFASWYRRYAGLSKNDMVTVFAPTNAAFERIAPSIRKNLAKNEVLKARTVLKHVVTGLWFSSSMPSSGIVLTPMDGVGVTCTTGKFEFDGSNRSKYNPSPTADKVLTFGSSRVIASDFFAMNGVVHIVDKVNTDQLELCGFN